MSVEKISLNSFRAFLFFFFGGAGCLLPFVSLHLKSVGLSADETQLISYASPLFAALGPVFIGPLVDYLLERKKKDVKKSSKSDKNTYVRTVLSISVLLSAVFYCLLLSVSTIEHTNNRQPEATFVCDENGAAFAQEKCNQLNCFSAETGVATLSNCKFNCNLPPHYAYLDKPFQDVEAERNPNGFLTTTQATFTTQKITSRPRSIRPEIDISNLDDFFGSEPNDDYDEDGSGEDSEFNWNKKTRQKREQGNSGFLLEESPHICYDKKVGRKSSRTCYVFTPSSAAFNVSLTVKPYHGGSEHCSYPLGTNFSCRIPPVLEKPKEFCKVVCDLEELYPSDDGTFLQSQCDQYSGDPTLTFWTYLTFRSFGDLFFSASVALLIGATIMAAGEEAGREFILPSLSYGLFASVIGYLYSDDMSPVLMENIPNFFLGIVGYGILTVFSLLILIFATNLGIEPSGGWKNTRNAQMRHKAEFYAVLLVLLFLGILWGPIYFHIPWHLTVTGGLELYVGCAAATGALLSVPFVWKAYKIVDYCGYSNILIGAFTIYILRYTGLLFIYNPWVLCGICGLEAITLCLMLFAAVFYIRHLAPKHFTFSSQAFAVAVHFCLGGGLGCLVSSFLSPSDDEFEFKLENKTTTTMSTLTFDPESEFEGPYHLLYCVGAVTAAICAVAYFFLYHCFLKKRCLAPLYRNDQNGAVPQDSSEKGMYTPLRVIRNGKQVKDEVET